MKIKTSLKAGGCMSDCKGNGHGFLYCNQICKK